MGITASTYFVLFGAALLLLYRQKAVSVAQFLSIIAGLWALLSIIGYAYQAEQLFAMRYTGIALETAIALFILSLGFLLSSVAIVEQGEERLRRQAVLIDLSYEPILVWIFGGPIVEWTSRGQNTSA